MDNNPPFNKKNSFVCKKGMREIWIRKKNKIFPPFSLSFISIDQRSDILFYGMEENQKDLVHIHEVLNFWAELDLNQRRHCQRIYSPSPLTTRASTQEEFILGFLIIYD